MINWMDHEELIAIIKTGKYTQEQIAREIAFCHITTVAKFCKHYNLDMREYQKNYKKEIDNDIRREFSNGKSIYELSGLYDLNLNTIKNILHIASKKKTLSEEDKEQIKKLLLEGVELKDIAKEVGFSMTTIRTVINEAISQGDENLKIANDIRLQIGYAKRGRRRANVK